MTTEGLIKIEGRVVGNKKIAKERWKMIKFRKKIIVGLAIGMLMSTTTVFATTRDFIFHMDESYLHGKDHFNTGYVASKSDDEQAAYITVNQFQRSNNAIVSMWVSPPGYPERELTDPWSWESVQPTKRLGYAVPREKGDTHQLSAEQFGLGTAVLSGRWTP